MVSDYVIISCWAQQGIYIMRYDLERIENLMYGSVENLPWIYPNFLEFIYFLLEWLVL